jgi:co-chaperonin GroES (HSP10)|tara:strand:- start:141 stop:431 length:291 start_codon:yes stop_codon:yes gene_type:complete
MKFKGQALNSNVVVKETEIENITDSGLDLTSSDDRNQKFKKGIVISIGLQCPKKTDGTDSLKIGDEILYDSYRSTAFTLETEVYSIIKFDDITIVL